MEVVGEGTVWDEVVDEEQAAGVGAVAEERDEVGMRD